MLDHYDLGGLLGSLPIIHTADALRQRLGPGDDGGRTGRPIDVLGLDLSRLQSDWLGYLI